MDFEQELQKKTEMVEHIIKEYMPREAGFQKTVVEAMEYTMSAGGKRIRPVLMMSSYELLGGREKLVEPFMAAMEMIHTYSLIHDDLPALDNDDYRRGRKTAHIVYGEAMAILAGDSLLNYAYETAVKAFDLLESKYATNAGLSDRGAEELRNELRERKHVEQALAILAAKPGIYGMIGGQVADVELTGSILNEEQLTFIYENKTGALIEASMLIGGILVGAEESAIEKLQKVAYNIGMAFQIQDDILDETATFEELGKPIHSDEKNEKVTYVTLHGIDASKREAERLSEEAVSLLNSFGPNAKFLTELTRYLIHRKN